MDSVFLRIFMLGLFLPFSLKAQFDLVFKLPFPERLYAIDSIFYKSKYFSTDTSIAKNNIENLLQFARQNKDRQSQLLGEIYALRLKEIINLRYQGGTSISLAQSITRFQELIQICKEEKYTVLQMLGLINLGDLLRSFSMEGAALSYELKAFNLYTAADLNYKIDIHLIANKIGSAYYKIGDYTNAKKYGEFAFTRQGKHYNHFNILNCDLLYLIHLKSGDYAGAIHYLDEGRKLFEQSDTLQYPYKGWGGIFQGNLGKVYYSQGKYAQAIPLLRYAMQITGDAHMLNNVSMYGLLLANCLVKLGNLTEVKKLIPILKQAVYLGGWDQNYVDLYKLMLTVPDANQSIERTKLLLDSVDIWTAKISQIKDQNFQIKKDLDFEIESYKKKEAIMTLNIQNQLIYRNVLWGILGVIVIIAFGVLYIKQKQLRVQKKEVWATKEMADKELAFAMEELYSFKDLLVEKNKKIETLETSQYSDRDILSLENLRSNTILTDEDWIKFKHLFEQVYSGFLTRLHHQFKGLTEGDIRFVVLLKLSLNNKQMASCLGVSVGAIRTIKSRLIKKIQIPGKEHLEDVVEMI